MSARNGQPMFKNVPLLVPRWWNKERKIWNKMKILSWNTISFKTSTTTSSQRPPNYAGMSKINGKIKDQKLKWQVFMLVSLQSQVTFQTPFHKLCEVTLEMAMEEIGLLNSKRLNRIMKRKNACVKIRDFVRQERRRIRNRQFWFRSLSSRGVSERPAKSTPKMSRYCLANTPLCSTHCTECLGLIEY